MNEVYIFALIDLFYNKLIFVNKEYYSLLTSDSICKFICNRYCLQYELKSFINWYVFLTYLRHRYDFDNRRCSYHYIYGEPCQKVKEGDIVELEFNRDLKSGIQFVRSSNIYITYKDGKIDFFSMERTRKFPVITSYPISYWSDVLDCYDVYVNLLPWKDQILGNAESKEFLLISKFVYNYITYYLLIYDTDNINNIFSCPYTYYCRRNSSPYWKYTLHVKKK